MPKIFDFSLFLFCSLPFSHQTSIVVNIFCVKIKYKKLILIYRCPVLSTAQTATISHCFVIINKQLFTSFENRKYLMKVKNKTTINTKKLLQFIFALQFSLLFGKSSIRIRVLVSQESSYSFLVPVKL